MNDIRIPDVSSLQRIQFFSDLSENKLIALANQLKVFTAKKNEVILERGSMDSASLYVLRGHVSLLAADGKVRYMDIDDKQELTPIAQLRPCFYDIKALGPVVYLKIDEQKLIDFAELPESESCEISVHTLFKDYDDQGSSIANNLYQNLIDGTIKWPAMPSVASRVQEIYKGDQTNINAMTEILSSYTDVAKIITKVAGNYEKSSFGKTYKITQAIGRVGISTAYYLIMIYSVGKLVNRLPARLVQLANPYWQRSLDVAALSRVIAKKTGLFSRDEAMLAGLVQGIGVFVIADYLLHHHDFKLDEEEIDHVIQTMRPEISGMLLRKWDFSEELILTGEECGKWNRNEEKPVDLCDLVLVANYFSLMESKDHHSLPLAGSIPAIGKLEIKPEDGFTLINKAKTVRKNIEQLLR